MGLFCCRFIETLVYNLHFMVRRWCERERNNIIWICSRIRSLADDEFEKGRRDASNEAMRGFARIRRWVELFCERSFGGIRVSLDDSCVSFVEVIAGYPVQFFRFTHDSLFKQTSNRNSSAGLWWNRCFDTTSENEWNNRKAAKNSRLFTKLWLHSTWTDVVSL